MADEYIRKQDAKDALQEKVFHNLTDEFYGAMQVLDELEPADVVTLVHGEWIHMGCGLFECNKCGEKVLTKVYVSEEASDRFKFCPNCGAKMDGGKNG